MNITAPVTQVEEAGAGIGGDLGNGNGNGNIGNGNDPANAKVENPEGVLNKNRELLEKNSRYKSEVESLSQRLKEFEKAEAERQAKQLERKGEWETLRAKMEESHSKALSEKDARYSALFENASRDQLAVELGKHALREGVYGEQLAKLLLLDEIRPVEENGQVVWRRKDTDEQVKLNEFIPKLAENPVYDWAFAAKNNPGIDARGNIGKAPTTLHRTKMSTAEKSAYVTKYGQAAFLQLPD